MSKKPEQIALAPEDWIPPGIGVISDQRKDLPKIAKNAKQTAAIEEKLPQIPTTHRLYNADARNLEFLPDGSVQLVVTSPPYWTLKKYRECEEQLGHITDYEDFLEQLCKVWEECYRVLVPGGRVVCVVGDVCLSRRKNKDGHTVIPLHSSIQENCRTIGFANLAPIIWYKISNAAHEALGNGAGFLGKPYEPNAVIKNDIEFILIRYWSR